MRMLKKLIIINLLSLVASVAFAQPQTGDSSDSSNTTSGPQMSTAPTGPDITGKYHCSGYDPFGKSNYGNPVTVTKNGDTFNFQWLNSKNFPFIFGTGVMHPNINNMVSVVFWDPKKADYFGTEVFAIKPDGSMTATWTVQGENQVGTETCTKDKT